MGAEPGERTHAVGGGVEGGGALESGGSPAAQQDEGGWREKRKAASQGLDSPVPLAPALQTRPAGTRKRSQKCRSPGAALCFPGQPHANRSPSRLSLLGGRPPPGRPVNAEP